jgi:hypothetical protein
MEDLRQYTVTTAKRLIKNSLRHHISSTRASEDDKWSSLAYVNEVVLRHAQEDWDKLKPFLDTESQVELETLVRVTQEVVSQVREEFQGHCSTDWLDKRLGDWLEAFCPEDML